MRNRELLKRIDRHLDQTDDHWASIDEELRLSREQRERHAEMFGDLRHFTRDMMRRMELVTQEHVRASTAQVQVSQEIVREIRDLREESRAQRQALLRMLDRFGPGEAPSAA